jgi:hypothetical protein
MLNLDNNMITIGIFIDTNPRELIYYLAILIQYQGT